MFDHTIAIIDSAVEATNFARESFLAPLKPVTDIVYMPVREMDHFLGIGEALSTLLLTQQLAFVIAFGFNFLESPSARKWYSTLTGLFLSLYLHGTGLSIIVFQFACIYPLIVLLPRKQAYGIVMTITTAIMVLRCAFMWWETNLDGAMRVQCTVIFMRVHIFMCNYIDAEVLDDAEKGKYLLPQERKYAAYVRTLPSFVDWCHYNMFAPFSFVGESIEYGIFDDFINYRGDVTKMRKFSNLEPAVRRQMEHLFCFFVFWSLGQIAHATEMTTPEFMDVPVWHKMFFMVITANCNMYLLFARFAQHEASFIACGISYTARTEKTPEEFNSIRSINIMNFQWGTTAKDSISQWNMRTQHWLKYYVMMREMDRTQPRGKFQAIPVLKTFLVSAVFHGIFIGYYFFFFGLFLMDVGMKFWSQSKPAAWIREIMNEKFLYFVGWATTQLLIRYTSVPFSLLTWDKCIQFFRNYYYIGHIVPLTMVVIGLALPARKPKKQQSVKPDVETEETDLKKIS